jgi:hypothetical protein
MHAPARTFAVAALIVILAGAVPFSQQGEQARLTGRVTDGSGGALPGVTVTLSAPRGSRPVVVVTDRVGQYRSPPLAPDTYAVTFTMPGFAPRTNPAVVLQPGEVFVLDRQLSLASVTETVTVTGAAPPPPPAATEPLPPVRQRPQTIPIQKVFLASVCGPDTPAEFNVTVGHIVGHRDDPRRELFGPGDVLLLDVGAEMGMAAGQNFVARRRFRTGDKGALLKNATFGEHTAGLIQVVETTAEASVAVVVYACGEFMAGDSLEPFDPQLVMAAQAPGEPQFEDPAHIVFGELGREIAGPKQLMVIDRGLNQGVVRGQRFTVFRRAVSGGGPIVRVGDGVIAAVRPQSATIQIERVSDAVVVGDLVALHK